MRARRVLCRSLPPGLPGPGPPPARHTGQGGSGQHNWLRVGGALEALKSWARTTDGRTGEATPGGTACSWLLGWPNAGGVPHRPQRDHEGPTRPGPPASHRRCSTQGQHAFPMVLCPKHERAGHQAALKQALTAPAGREGGGAETGCGGSGTNGTGHQGAASAHRWPAQRCGTPGPLSLQPDGSPTDLPRGSGAWHGHCASRRRPAYGEKWEPSAKALQQEKN